MCDFAQHATLHPEIKDKKPHFQYALYQECDREVRAVEDGDSRGASRASTSARARGRGLGFVVVFVEQGKRACGSRAARRLPDLVDCMLLVSFFRKEGKKAA
eukprot:1429472-Rhodomonas_salina.1